MDCLFCKINYEEIPSYTYYENEYVNCFLDINPQSKGHTLIVPKKHFKDMQDIDNGYLTEVNIACKKIINILNKTYNPVGIKLVQNNGLLQDIKHYHLHVVPYYKKDDTFDIKEVYNELKKNCD